MKRTIMTAIAALFAASSVALAGGVAEPITKPAAKPACYKVQIENSNAFAWNNGECSLIERGEANFERRERESK